MFPTFVYKTIIRAMLSSRAPLTHQQFMTFFPFSKLYPFSGARWMWDPSCLKIAHYSKWSNSFHIHQQKWRQDTQASKLTSLGLQKSLHLFFFKLYGRILPNNHRGNIIWVSIQHIVNKLLSSYLMADIWLCKNWYVLVFYLSVSIGPHLIPHYSGWSDTYRFKFLFF